MMLLHAASCLVLQGRGQRDRPPDSGIWRRAGIGGGLTLEFFYDYSSPWTYLAFTRIEDLYRRAGAELGTGNSCDRPPKAPLWEMAADGGGRSARKTSSSGPQET